MEQVESLPLVCLGAMHATLCCCHCAYRIRLLPHKSSAKFQLCTFDREMPQKESTTHSPAIVQLVRRTSLQLDGSDPPLPCNAILILTSCQDAGKNRREHRLGSRGCALLCERQPSA